jgi:hypothetical protein
MSDCNPTEGRVRRDRAHDLLEEYRQWLITAARRALLVRLLAYPTATIDDVRDVVTIPPGVDPVCMGAAPGALSRAGIIERAGYAETGRAVAHARPVSVWRLADRAAAERWLAEHPAEPMPRPPACTPRTSTQGTLWDAESQMLPD